MKFTCLRFLWASILACLISVGAYGQAVGHVENEDPKGPTPVEDEFRIIAKVSVANLQLHGEPDEYGFYSLPNNRPDIYANCNIDNGLLVGTVLLDGFRFDAGLTQSAANGISYFSARAIVGEINLSSTCDTLPECSSVSLPYTLDLVTKFGYPYPMCNFTNTFDIFSCAAFDVTAPYCDDQGRTAGTGTNNGCNSATLTSVSGNSLYYCSNCPINTFNDNEERSDIDDNDEALLNDIVVTPNPFNELIQVSWEGIAGIEDIRLFDASGKLLEQRDFSLQSDEGNWYINTEKLPSGLYFLHLKNAANAKVIKLIKQ